MKIDNQGVHRSKMADELSCRPDFAIVVYPCAPQLSGTHVA